MNLEMNKIYTLFFLTFVLSTTLLSQQIEINLGNVSEERAALFSLKGEKVSFIDSISIEQNGTFIYNTENLSTGFYQFRVNGKSPITFIYSGEDVELKANAENLSRTIEVVKSECNRIYYDFVKRNRDYKTKTELLQLILARYPKDDDYYQTTISKLDQLQVGYTSFVDSVISINSTSFISRYIQSSQLPIVDFTLPIERQIAYLKSNALEKVDFDDAELINSDCFTNKSIEYLTYYRNPQLPMGLLEQEFKKAVDTLLTKASINIFVYQHIADYLIDGFKQFGFDNVVDYIVEKYVVKDDLCLDEQTENSIQNRINQSRLLTAGTKAPNIILPDAHGEEFNLEKLTAKKTLLIFYASWCPHCQDLLPEIYELYKQRNDFEVVAISLDENREDWISFITENNLDWINVSDLKGWDSKAAQDYFIYATPTLFFLDKDREIVGKPRSNEELTDLLASKL